MRDAVPGFAGIVHAQAISSRSPRATTSNRASSCARARAGRSRTARSARADFKSLPARAWTLLVQGVNLDDAADALLRRFAFMPYARLDDLMVSYAAPGGGVGPHFDSYDVFLLQGFGRRRWRYGAQRDLSLRARPAAQDPAQVHARPRRGARAAATCSTCRPSVAHDGIAVDACTTYSIGFRAPRRTRSSRGLPRSPARPGRAAGALRRSRASRPPRQPARITPAHAASRALRRSRRSRWDARSSARFLGAYAFRAQGRTSSSSRPTRRSRRARFAAAHRASAALRLDRRTQLLYDDDAMYVNGEARDWPRGRPRVPATLANARALSAAEAAQASRRHR